MHHHHISVRWQKERGCTPAWRQSQGIWVARGLKRLALTMVFWPLATLADGAGLLRETLAPLDTFSSTFTQQTTTVDGTVVAETQGKLWLARPRQFRIEVTGDFPEVNVSDGVTWWVFEADLQQAIVRDLAENASKIPVLVLTEQTEATLARYNVDYFDDEDGRAFVLAPKAQDALYASISLRFRAGTPESVQVRSAIGESTVVRFTGSTVNQPLDPGRFGFEVPEGTDVIDERTPDAGTPGD